MPSDLYGRDVDNYYAWLEKHKNAHELIADQRTGYIIKAVYFCPESKALSEGLDFLALLNTLKD